MNKTIYDMPTSTDAFVGKFVDIPAPTTFGKEIGFAAGNAVEYLAQLTAEGKVLSLWHASETAVRLRSRINNVLSVSDEVISALKRNIEYNGFYAAYLLNQLSDEEFRKIGEEFAIELLTPQDTSEFEEKIKILFMLSSAQYTPSELSNIFKIDIDVVDKILDHLAKSNFIR